MKTFEFDLAAIAKNLKVCDRFNLAVYNQFDRSKLFSPFEYSVNGLDVDVQFDHDQIYINFDTYPEDDSIISLKNHFFSDREIENLGVWDAIIKIDHLMGVYIEGRTSSNGFGLNVSISQNLLPDGSLNPIPDIWFSQNEDYPVTDLTIDEIALFGNLLKGCVHSIKCTIDFDGNEHPRMFSSNFGSFGK